MEVAQESLNEVNNDTELLKCVITDDETVYGEMKLTKVTQYKKKFMFKKKNFLYFRITQRCD